jgi:GGDEF domain-containing protein
MDLDHANSSVKGNPKINRSQVRMTPFPDYPIPDNEEERLRSLERVLLLDTDSDAHLDRITTMACEILETPIALISLVDHDRQWFLSRVGLEASETPRNMAFCTHAIMQPDVMVIHDATKDPRFSTNPLVTSGPKIRFYAGAPLQSVDGKNLGTLCVIDHQPHTLTILQKKLLQQLSELVNREIEVRQQLSCCPLTGLRNRDSFLFLGEKEYQRARRLGSKPFLISFAITDPRLLGGTTQPYSQGSLLSEFIAASRLVFSEVDLMGRLADDHFAVLMVDADLHEAESAARALSLIPSSLRSSWVDEQETVPICIGISGLEDSDLSFSDLLIRAENACYLAMDESSSEPIRTVQNG